jgi:hypothetical protein
LIQKFAYGDCTQNPFGGTAPPNSIVDVPQVTFVLPSIEPELVWVCGAVAAQVTDRQAKAAAVIASTDFVFIDGCSLPFEIAKRKVDRKDRATVLSPLAKNLRFAASELVRSSRNFRLILYWLESLLPQPRLNLVEMHGPDARALATDRVEQVVVWRKLEREGLSVMLVERALYRFVELFRYVEPGWLPQFPHALDGKVPP